MQFKIGDKLRCIRHPIGHYDLHEGDVGIVERTHEGEQTVRLVGIDGAWSANRFKYAKISNEDRVAKRKEELCNTK